ncbi:MAG: hypothetical protein Tsb0010_08990 [Parvularculaceae bacterium]
MSKLSRREFALAASGAALAFAPPSTIAADAAETLPEKFAGLIANRNSAAALGRAILGETRADRDAIAARLCARIALSPDAALAQPAAALQRACAAQMRRDFADGETVSLEGWVLSATEADLYALAALTR